MNLLAVEQPFIFPGLNERAIDFLLSHGDWFDFSKTDGASGIVVDIDKFTFDDKYSAISGVYVNNRVIISRVYKVTIIGDFDVPLYKYRLSDGSWVREVIDQLIDDTRPILCLEDEYKMKSFKWSTDEIEEAIMFMIENDLFN